MAYMAHIMGWHSSERHNARADDAPADSNAIRDAQLGNRETFVRLISSYDTAVFRLAWNFTQSAGDAAEIYEQVFTAAYRLLPSYSGKDSFLVWLFRIATGCCLAYSPKPGARNSWPGGAPDDARIPLRLQQAMMQLSPRDRLVFVLRHELQFKSATIARMLDTPESMVQSALTRAFFMLRTAAQAIGIRQ
jgi:RNA polymerase sigma-70 factor, ECF subfamily